MGFLDTISAWFKRERTELTDSMNEVHDRLDADLSRRERELHATPEERLRQLQSQIDDDPFAEIRAKVEGLDAQSHAVAELSDHDGDEEIIELESEEIDPTQPRD